jgi:sorbitol-specific phosphotransferase system component IIC
MMHFFHFKEKKKPAKEDKKEVVVHQGLKLLPNIRSCNVYCVQDLAKAAAESKKMDDADKELPAPRVSCI